MPLQDHFHPPLSLRRHWHAFHHAWATYLSSQLNQRLPPGYFAEPNVKFGIEIDVASFDERPDAVGQDAPADAWQPEPPLLTLPFTPATDVIGASRTISVVATTAPAAPPHWTSVDRSGHVGSFWRQ